MARSLDILLDEDSTIAKRVDSFFLGELEAFLSLLVIEGNSHALSTTASARLDHYRVANLIGNAQYFLHIIDLAKIAGYGAHSSTLGQLL